MNGASQTRIRQPKRRLTKLWIVLVALGLTASVAACNGGGDGGSSPTAQPTGSATPQPTGQAATSAACQTLASLDRYRYVSNLSLESPEELVPSSEGQPTPVATLTREYVGLFDFDYNTDASWVAPDRVEASISAAGSPLNLVIIGDRHWVTLAGEWREVGPEYVLGYGPLEVCNAIFPEIDLTQAQGEKETVNGVSALHYTFADTPTGQAMAAIFGPQSDEAILFQTMNVEVWVAEKDGFPVRMDIEASGLYGDRRELKGQLRIELRDINADDIEVEPPI